MRLARVKEKNRKKARMKRIHGGRRALGAVEIRKREKERERKI